MYHNDELSFHQCFKESAFLLLDKMVTKWECSQMKLVATVTTDFTHHCVRLRHHRFITGRFWKFVIFRSTDISQCGPVKTWLWKCSTEVFWKVLYVNESVFHRHVCVTWHDMAELLLIKQQHRVRLWVTVQAPGSHVLKRSGTFQSHQHRHLLLSWVCVSCSHAAAHKTLSLKSTLNSLGPRE